MLNNILYAYLLSYSYCLKRASRWNESIRDLYTADVCFENYDMKVPSKENKRDPI